MVLLVAVSSTCASDRSPGSSKLLLSTCCCDPSATIMRGSWLILVLAVSSAAILARAATVEHTFNVLHLRASIVSKVPEKLKGNCSNGVQFCLLIKHGLYIFSKFSGRDTILAAHQPTGECEHHRRGWTTRSRDRSLRRRHRGGPRHQRLSTQRDDPLVRTSIVPMVVSNKTTAPPPAAGIFTSRSAAASEYAS